MEEGQFFTQLSLEIPLIKISPLIANGSWPSRGMPIGLLMLTMFFKGRSKSFDIYLVEIVMLSINVNHRDLIAI
jgi:hypothetical protein